MFVQSGLQDRMPSGSRVLWAGGSRCRGATHGPLSFVDQWDWEAKHSARGAVDLSGIFHIGQTGSADILSFIGPLFWIHPSWQGQGFLPVGTHTEFTLVAEPGASLGGEKAGFQVTRGWKNASQGN